MLAALDECLLHSKSTQQIPFHCVMISFLSRLLLLTTSAFYHFILLSSSHLFLLTNLSQPVTVPCVEWMAFHLPFLLYPFIPHLSCCLSVPSLLWPVGCFFIPVLSCGLSALLLPLRILLLLCLRQTNFLTSKVFLCVELLSCVCSLDFGVVNSCDHRSAIVTQWFSTDELPVSTSHIRDLCLLC